jgi:medium-chain acyl-[acyl-carrier-protein] hydrolase
MSLLRWHKTNAGARLRLFCFPFAGGIGVYNSWFDELPADVRSKTELCSILFPGHEANYGGALISSLAPLIDLLCPAIAPYQDIPFAFFGHSMGALVSFELARQLRRQDVPGPVHMIVSGHRAPQLPDLHQAIHELPAPEFWRQLRELSGTPEAVLQNPELMELLLPVLRADFAVCERYQYADEDPLDCSITVFGGNNDARVSHPELCAWQTQTRNAFCVRMFPGGHFFVQTAQMLVLRILAEDLKPVLKGLTQG